MLSVELKKEIGQMLMAGFPSPYVDDQAKALLKDFYVGNYIYFARNVDSITQITTLSKELSDLVYDALGASPFLSMDQEGGLVSRLTEGAALIPGAAAVSAGLKDLDEASLLKVEQLGENTGAILRAAGINLNLAPDMDVNIEPKNPVIGARSYGDDPHRVSLIASAMERGFRKAGVLGSIKHFPGHGNTASDSHLSVPVNDTEMEVLLETEFKPFEEAIRQGAQAVLSCHVCYTKVDPAVPATLSKKIQTGILRERFGFKGLLLTDCLEMDAIRAGYPHGEGAVRAVEAGADILTISHTYEAVKEAAEALYKAVASGRISEERIHASYERILGFKKAMGLCERQKLDPEEAKALCFSKERLSLAEEMALHSVTLLQGSGEVDLKGEDVLLVASDHAPSTGAEDMRPLSLCEMAERLYGMETVRFPFALKKEEAAGVMDLVKEKAQQGRTKVLFGIYNGRFREGARQVLELLLKDPRLEITLLLLGTPYDLPALIKEPLDQYPAKIKGVLTTYEYTMLSARALLTALEKKEFLGSNPFGRLE